jgi:hypothetical protein
MLDVGRENPENWQQISGNQPPETRNQKQIAHRLHTCLLQAGINTDYKIVKTLKNSTLSSPPQRGGFRRGLNKQPETRNKI